MSHQVALEELASFEHEHELAADSDARKKLMCTVSWKCGTHYFVKVKSEVVFTSPNLRKAIDAYNKH